jgi:hypothetical protein
MRHELKTWMPYFQDILDGKKTFEYRRNDRNFQLLDIVILQEWNQDTEIYTGREYPFLIKYIIYGGQFGIPKDYCIMSL